MLQEFDYVDHYVEKLGFYTGYFLVKGAKLVFPKISYCFAGFGFIQHVGKACENSRFTRQEIFERCIDASTDAFEAFLKLTIFGFINFQSEAKRRSLEL